MEKNKLCFVNKKLEFFNRIRTNLLIYSNEENQQYLKYTTILLNSIQPKEIIKKFDIFEVKFENPIINYKTELFPKKPIKEYDYNLNEENQNNFSKTIFNELAHYLKNIKITCSLKKLGSDKTLNDKENNIQHKNINLMSSNSLGHYLAFT